MKPLLSGLYSFACKAEEWTSTRVDSDEAELESLESFPIQDIGGTALFERTLDTMKFAMIMETTMGSSWLTRLIPLKSLSVCRNLHFDGNLPLVLAPHEPVTRNDNL